MEFLRLIELICCISEIETWKRKSICFSLNQSVHFLSGSSKKCICENFP